VDGQFCATTCPRARGDVDGDGDAAEAFDGLQILRHVMGIPTVYDPIPLCVADTNCSGDVGLIDVVSVLRRATHLIPDYCVEETPETFGKSSFGISAQAGVLTPGEAFEVTLDLTALQAGPTYGYGFIMTFDPEVVSFSGAVDRTGTLSARWGNPTVQVSGNTLRLAALNPYTPLTGTGTLVKLVGHAALDAVGPTDLQFTRF